MAQISIRIDDNLKIEAEQLFNELGLTLSGAFTIFIRQSLRQRGIPFVITAQPDPFYNPVNLERLERAIGQMKSGDTVSKTFEAPDGTGR